MPKRYQDPKLQVRKDVAKPFYFIRVRIHSKEIPGKKPPRKELILGRVGEITLKEAMKRRAAELDAINSRLIKVHATIRFKDLCEQFLAVRVPQLGIATQRKYETQIRNHILPAFGELKLCDIDPVGIENWLRSKEQEGLGWWSRIDLKGIMSAIFTAAKGWKQWEGDNPTEGIRIGRKRLVREKRLLTIDEFRRLLGALPERPKFIVTIMFGLGLRISEVLGLKWSDVDFQSKTITIRRRWHRGDLSEDGDTKTEASCAVMALGPSMLQEFRSSFYKIQPQHETGRSCGETAGGEPEEAGTIREIPSSSRRGFVFLGEDSLPPDDRDLLREELRPVLKRLKLYYRGFGWHAFRRANITFRQQIGGATPLEAQRAARHASLDMTYLYTLSDHERESSQQQAMFDKLMETQKGEIQ